MAGATFDSSALDIAIDPALDRAFVLNSYNSVYGQGTVAAFDGATATLLTTRLVAGNVLAINPVTHYEYVAGISGGFPDPTLHGTLTAIDAKGSVNNVDLGEGQKNTDVNSVAVAVDSAANKIYVASPFGYMTVVNGATQLPAAVDKVSNGQQIALNEKTHALYVVGHPSFGTSVDVVDGTGGTSPVASVFPKNLSFSTKLNIPSAPQVIYAANVGSLPMTLSNLIFNGIDYRSVQQSNNCPDIIQPHQVCPISLVYLPTASSPSSDSGPYAIDVLPPGVSTTLNIQAQVTP